MESNIKPKLSAIVPIRNMGGRLQNLRKWINRLVESNLDIEVILIHDGTDLVTQLELEEIVESSNSNRITMEQIEVESPGLARNRGITLAKGEWICFWDSDDEVKVDEVANLLSDLNDPYTIVIAGFEEVRNVGTKSLVSVRKPRSMVDVIDKLGLWRMFFNKAIIEQIRFPSLKMGEDQLFFVSVTQNDQKIKFSPQVVYRYFHHEFGQLTQNRVAIRDLKFCLIDLERIVGEEFRTRKIAKRVFVRQILTCISSPYWELKLAGLGVVARSLFSGKIQKFLNICIGIVEAALVRRRAQKW